MAISATRLAGLDPRSRANFAVTARLLSCLVTESLLRALYFPIHGLEATGICVILGDSISSPVPQSPYESKDITAIIPLRYLPIFRHDGTDPRAREISLLDPLDMLPLILEVDLDGTQTTQTDVCIKEILCQLISNERLRLAC